MAVVESPSNNRVSYDPTATISVAVKIHKVVISDNVWTTQDNPIVAAASVIVVPLVHRHTPQCNPFCQALSVVAYAGQLLEHGGGGAYSIPLCSHQKLIDHHRSNFACVQLKMN